MAINSWERARRRMLAFPISPPVGETSRSAEQSRRKCCTSPGRVISSIRCVMPIGLIAGAHDRRMRSGQNIFNGMPLTIPGQPEEHPCIMDGASFWLHVEEFVKLRLQVKKPLNIGVIGTGETAAAIVVALVDILRSSAFIEVISPYGVIYSRDEGFEENRLFSDPDGKLASLYSDHQHAANWLQLNERDRREFLKRTDRGVFSLKAMAEISNAENVRSVLGTVRRIHAKETTVRVDSEYDGKMKHDEYDYVVVARGFDALWYRPGAWFPQPQLSGFAGRPYPGIL